MNIQAPNITSLELASQITFSRKIAKCFASRASFLLVFLIKIVFQMILAQTIDRARNALYTVTNKLLVQLVAKIGGEPWAINELPFFHLCSMTAGYYVSNS